MKVRFRTLLAALTSVSAYIVLTSSAFAASPAAFTTVNESADGTGHCLNGNPAVNCNIYDGKQYVWMNGGPSAAALPDGSYFFAVLNPSGQANPNDGSADLLSTDPYTNRTFSVSSGAISNYSGSHDYDSAQSLIRLLPYADTANPGGVYIMAICSLASGYPVDPSVCKYDAFKVGSEVTPGQPLTITKDATGSNTDTWTWGITKSVDTTSVTDPSGSHQFNYTVTVTHDGGTVSGVKVTGTISVFNPNVDSSNNTVPVSISGVTDTLSNGVSCTVQNGGAQTLTAAKTNFTYTCDLSGLPQGQLDNTATVQWSDQLLDNGSLLNGSSSDFTFKSIAFTATNVDSCVSVSDPLGGGNLGTVCQNDPSPTTIPYSYTVQGTPGTCVNQDNTATFTTNTTGTTGSASQTVTLCTPVDLQVSKTANPSFTRTYQWSIQKSVDKTLVKQVGGSAVFNYTVQASETGFSDSAWQATGTITVTNPNDFEAIGSVTVTDSTNNGGSCTVTGGTNISIPASGSVPLSYTCTYSSAPSPSSGTNTATATWDQAAAKTPDGSASGTANFAFTTPASTVHKTITPTDSFNGGSPVNLCTLDTSSPCALTATDSTPYTSQTYHYSRSTTVPTYGCVDYPNTASDGIGDTSGAKVTVCGPVKTGALTMGFWQNKNGQAIINGANQGNLGTWLRQFNPFSDAPSTGLAAYVSGIIKAATCSTSGTCNTMLRAQMLSTALDVYFSNSSLGGNKIGVPGPIGSVTIDLTKVCHMIDGSGGTATCSGTYENVSSAFGGATSMTVMQMLTYQNTADPLADKGAVWYSQVKATQVLAKDAFDAINNQVAFGA